MKRPMLLLFLLCGLVTPLVYTQVTMDIVLANPLPAELSSWEHDPSLLQIIITNSSPNGYPNLRLSFFIRDDESGSIVVESQDDRVPMFDVPALGTITRLCPDIYAGNAVTISDRINTLAVTTNRLPEGNYTLCFRLIDANGNSIATPEEVCRSSTVVIPDPPELLFPIDASILLEPNPTFSWTPVQILPGIEEARYRLVIAQMELGQSPRDAIDRNTPHYVGIVNTNSYTYTVSDPPFALGAQDRPFAWQVQALDRHDQPAARNEGKSPVWSFAVDSSDIDLFRLDVSAEEPMVFDSNVTSYPIRIVMSSWGGTTVTTEQVGYTLLQGLRIYESQRLPDLEGLPAGMGWSSDHLLNYTITPETQRQYLGNREYLDFTLVFSVTARATDSQETIHRERELRVMICRRPVGSGSLVYSVTSPSPMPLGYDPSTVRHGVNFRLFAEGCRSITVQQAVGTWTYPDGSTDVVEEDLRGEDITLSPGSAFVWAKTLTIDLATQEGFLRRYGGNEVRMEVEYSFTGVDDRGGSYETMILNPVDVVIRSSSFTVAASSPAGFPLNYSPGASSYPINFTFTNSSAGDIRITRYKTLFHNPDGTVDSVEADIAGEIVVGAGQTRDWPKDMVLDSAAQAAALQRFGMDNMRVRCEYRFTGIDAGGGTQIVTAQPDVEFNIRRTAGNPLSTFAFPSDVSFYPGVLTNQITYNLDLYASAPAPVTLTSTRVTYRFEDGTLYRGPDSSALEPSIELPVGSTTTTTSQLAVSDQDRQSLLPAGQDSRILTATVEFAGTDRLGNAMSTSTNPITMRVFRTAQAAGAEAYTLVDGVAFIRTTQQTTITEANNIHTLNGSASLVLILPGLANGTFDSSEAAVELTNLTFEVGARRRVTGGLVMGEAAPDGVLYSVYGGLLKLTRVSFDYVRPDTTRLMADAAYLSVGRYRIDLLDLLITRNGLSFRNASLEQSMFGLTFRFTDMQSGRENNHRMLSFTTHVRLKGKPREEEFVSAPLKIFETGDLSGHFTPTPALQIIPNTHYLDFRDFEFKKEGEQQYMKVTVETAYPAPFKRLGTIQTSFKIDQDNNMTGELAPIREAVPGIEQGDNTWVAIGDFAVVDLTYLGIQIALVDGEIDDAHSRVGLAADFTFNDGSRDWHRVSVGTVDNPGITIDFTGNVNWQAIILAQDKKFPIGPVYVKIASFIVNPEPDSTRPYFFLLSGGLGVDLAKVDGELNFQSIRIKENGRFDMTEAIIRGGQFSIADIIGVSLDSLDFKDEPSDLQFSKKVSGRNETQTVRVDSYFHLAGAALNIGPSGDGGSGGFKDLLLYTKDGNKNLILREAKVSIASCDIKIDCQYVTNDSLLGTAMSLAGTVRTPKFEGTVVGKAGETPDGSPTYGLFIAVGGLNIQIGPVTLDQLGGGFFYNPLPSDIDLVISACGMSRPELQDSISARRPAGAGDPGSFAAMIFAGAYVATKDVAKGHALLTITERSVSLDMDVTALKGAGNGSLYALVGWEPSYAEGVIKLGFDFQSLLTADAEVDFYAYSSDVWGFNGTTRVRILCLLEADADFFVGPPGFMLSTKVDMGFDVGVLAANAGIETMVWWQQDVSWGAYTKIYAEGEILWGLAGVAGSLEGALIFDPDPLLYAVGSFRAEVLWQEIFNGSIWITADRHGFDGGTGTNSRYDQVIADARNMADQMEQDVKDLEAALDAAQNSLMSMSNEQVARAGDALMTQITENDVATALYHVSYKTDHDDYEGTATTQSVLREILFGRTPRNNRWWIDTLQSGKQRLAGRQQAIQEVLEALDTKKQRMQRKLDAYRSVLTGSLPSIDEYPFRNAVGAPMYTVVNINGVARNVRYGFEFDSSRARQNGENALASKEALGSFERQLFEMTESFKRNLDTIDNLLYSGSEPVRDISRDFSDAFEDINDHYTDSFEYLEQIQNMAATRWNSLRGREASIRTAIHTQSQNVAPGERSLWRVRNLATLREGVIQSLDNSYNPVRRDNTLAGWKEFCDTLGVLMWYRIPEAGFRDLIDNCISSRDTVLSVFDHTRSGFVDRWNTYTETLEGIYGRISRLYELLYDLYDQLSLSATRLPVSPAVARQLGNPSPREYYATARERTGTLLEIPSITSFTGTARSSTDNSVNVTLNYRATHAHGIAEYAYKVTAPMDPAPEPGMLVFRLPGHFRSVGTGTHTGFLLVQRFGTGGPDQAGDYDVSLRARARCGYALTRTGTVSAEYSTGTTVNNALDATDNTPPSTPSVNDGGQFTSATSTLYARWSSSDGQSGIQEYQYEVETQQGMMIGGRMQTMPFRILDWTSAGGMTELNIRNLNLMQGKTYWIQVRARNGTGLWSEQGRSDGITVDTSGPAPLTITEFRHNPALAPPNRLTIRWTASQDGESGIDRYEYCIGTAPFGTNIAGWSSTDLTSLTTGALPLFDRQTCYVTVKAVNGAGLSSTDTASALITFADKTAPDPPEISEAYYRGKDSSLVVHWSSNDAESGIAEYQYCVSTSAAGTRFAPWINAGRITSLTVNIRPPRPLWVKVKAVNGVRLSSIHTQAVEKR